jgi:ribosomal protein S3
MAGAIIGKGGHNIQKLRTEVCIILSFLRLEIFNLIIFEILNVKSLTL